MCFSVRPAPVDWFLPSASRVPSPPAVCLFSFFLAAALLPTSLRFFRRKQTPVVASALFLYAIISFRPPSAGPLLQLASLFIWRTGRNIVSVFRTLTFACLAGRSDGCVLDRFYYVPLVLIKVPVCFQSF